MKKNALIFITPKKVFRFVWLLLLSVLSQTALAEASTSASRYTLACEDLALALHKQLHSFSLPLEFTAHSELRQEMGEALQKYHFEVCQDADCVGEKVELVMFTNSGLTVLSLSILNLTLSRGYTLRQRQLVPRTALSVGINE